MLFPLRAVVLVRADFIPVTGSVVPVTSDVIPVARLFRNGWRAFIPVTGSVVPVTSDVIPVAARFVLATGAPVLFPYRALFAKSLLPVPAVCSRNGQSYSFLTYPR